MDQKVAEIRHEQWRRTVYECINRDPKLSKRQWCEENGIKFRSLMYWQRKFRLEALEQMDNSQGVLPAHTSHACVPVFADVTAKYESLQADQEAFPQDLGRFSPAPELMIQAGAYRIYVSGSIQVPTLEKVMQVIRRA
ncbi:MAG: hypothetical protein J6S83_12770 [Lachnospiraceae bacterium]|nr:hypothetical protein [Lachnospiraceae bacterium]